MSFIQQPNDPQSQASLGGKAGALAALQTSGLAIPQWFVVLPHAFDASLAEERGAPPATGEVAAPALPRQLAPAVLRELESALARLCPNGELVAVRSSALDEDGRQHSFAGQFESFLELPPAAVAEHVVAVWKSGFSERVRAYRRLHGLADSTRPPAVLIQRMVHAETAGVAFGIDPVSSQPERAVVSAVRGLGTSLVNGERDADTWHVDPAGQILLRPRSHADPVLSDAQIQEVARLVRRTGQLLGHPQDVEWAFEQGRLYLLQSRPITTPVATPEALTIWDNSNIIESYSGVTRPLTFSFAQRAYTGVYRQFCQLLAVPRAKIAAHEQTFRHMLGLIEGRVYYHLLNWYRVLALLPGFTLNRRFMEQMMGVKEELPAEILAELGPARLWPRIKDGLDLSFSVAALVMNHFLLPRKIRRFYRRLDDALAPPPRPLEAMTAEELGAYFLGLEQKLLTRWDAPLLNDFFAMIWYGVLRRLLGKWADDQAGTLQNDLLCGEGGMISAEPAARVRALAELAAPHPQLVDRLRSGSLSEILGAMETVPEFKAAYLSYLEKFGDRCLEELKLESLTLHDDPLLLLRSIGSLAQHPVRPASSRNDATTPDVRQNAESRVQQALTGHTARRWVFPWVLRQARARVRDRENLRFQRTRLYGRVRRIFVQLGRRLHAAGQLEAARDVFLLEVNEVLGAVATTSTAPAAPLRELVRRRQLEFDRYQATEPPPNRFTTRGRVREATRATGVTPTGSNTGGEERHGTGCCPGVVRGRIRKVVDPRTAALQPGEILVAERTDPGWILLFPAAAGLLVERGSLLSHSAIVAREMRIPAVVAIDGLMGWLQDGDLVELDGSTGQIRRLPGRADGPPPKVVYPQPQPSAELDPVTS